MRAVLIGVLIGCSLAGCTCKPKAKKVESLNTLTLKATAKIKTLDPIYSEDTYSNDEVHKSYESLLQYHYLKRPVVLVPNLTEAMPEVSSDFKTYTFHLKKGVLFQDDPAFKQSSGKGREMIADDVIYSFMRLADPKLQATAWWTLDGKVVGLNEWREQMSEAAESDYSKPIEGLKAADRYSVQIKLTRPLSQFLYMTAMTNLSIVPREAVEYYGKEFGIHAVGTGPFRLEEFNPTSKVVWVRNPTFRHEVYPTDGDPGDRELGLLEDAGKPIPFVDRIVVQVVEETQSAWLNLMAGKLDVLEIPKDNFNRVVSPSKNLTEEYKGKFYLSKIPRMDLTRLTFNMADPILGKNKYLRQALSLAFDEEAFIEVFFNGRGIPAQGPIPPGMIGYDPKFRNPYRQFNQAKAKELLVKAGFPEGKGLPVFELMARAASSDRQAVEYTQKMFDAIGVKINPIIYTWPEFLASLKGRKGQIWNWAWSPDYPDPQNFFQQLYGKNVSPGPNDANYVNPEYDRLYEEALALPEGARKQELYKKMVDIVVEDCPWVFGTHRILYFLAHKWLKNFKYSELIPNRYKYYRIDLNQKK